MSINTDFWACLYNMMCIVGHLRRFQIITQDNIQESGHCLVFLIHFGHILPVLRQSHDNGCFGFTRL